MNVLEKLKSKYVILCPECNNELYFEAYSNETYYLKCLACNLFYNWNPKIKKLENCERYAFNLDKLKKKGLKDIDAAKLTTSEFFMPKWIKLLLRVFMKSD